MNGQGDPDPTSEASSTTRRENESLIAVGVGASAGGLEAFSELVSNISPVTGMAFIFVQHLDPHHESALPELLAARTRLPVVQVRQDTPLESDHIYVIPPNALMVIRDRALVLEARPKPPEQFRPIDSLFRSLAAEFRFNAVGIVLSGTATDGTLGLKAIKAEGGVTFAQDATAKFDSMPRSAISTGVVDFVLPPGRIGEELAAFARRARQIQSDNLEPGDGSTFHALLSQLRSQTGVDFAQYKQPTILRRLTRRMALRRSDSLAQYLELLKQDAEETRALFGDLLINVTDFFRDPAVFEAVKHVAFTSLVHSGLNPRVIRIWVPGCSSGEEVYSIAISLAEFLEAENLEYAVQIFGTDVSDSIIEKARSGAYDLSAITNISPERLRRFFVRTESGYQISRAIREMCVFSRHNIAKDPPLSRMNLISCRNLLIYFAASLQRRVISTFCYALSPGGFLILGSSETLGSFSDFFSTEDEVNRIYRRKVNLSRNPTDLFETAGELTQRFSLPPEKPRPVEAGYPMDRIPREVDRIVLSRYGPAGLVVDEALAVIEHRGDVGQYLSKASPEPNAELMSIVRPDLRTFLGVAVEQARRSDLTVTVERPGTPGNPMVSLTVIPLRLAGSATHFLILFGEARSPHFGIVAGDSEKNQPAEGVAESPAETLHLQQELRATREYLQSVIEELRSTNEEAQSANEELQSTNEELQTAKEELQSSNEELNTINTEMQSRNADLARINDDLINLLSSMNVPIVMTGSDLRIRRFTPTAEKVFRLIPTDIGRPIADLKPHINVPKLEEILRQVMDSLQPHEQDVHDQEGRHYLMRVRPYRTFDNRIDGCVLQLLDISELRRNLEEIRAARDFAQAIVNTVRAPLVVLDEKLVIQSANRAFHETFAVSHHTTLNQTIYEAAGGRFDLPAVRKALEADDRANELHDIEIEYPQENGETRSLLLNVRRLRTSEKKHLTLMAFEDITERKRAAEVRYRRLFESARDGIVLVDAASGEVLDLNPFSERLLGYPKNELVGRKLWEIGPTANVQTLRASLQRVRDQGALRVDDWVIQTKDGRELHTEVIANTYSEGERRAIQLNIRDVSERKKFEQELQQTQRLEGLGLLAGGIAHDFNNLLTGILGNASLAYTELAPDQGARLRLREIIQASESAAFLTRQMLAYAGRGRFVIETLNLGDLVRDISTLIKTSIPRTVELKLDLAPNLPPIDADPAQLQQVVMNLVINGAEAIEENRIGKVEIRTSLRQFTEQEAAEIFGPGQAGEYVQLEVSDTGSGMDEPTQSRVFDPFFTTKFTGRGLGLAAVQGIVKSHGGSIRLYSTPGHGTSFVVLLPASRHPVQDAIEGTPPPPAIPAGSVALVIDDEESIRTLANNVLSREGMRVLTTADGRSGVDLFQEHHGIISVVLLDLTMPVLSGGDALAKIRAINPNVPVILSSGFDERETARKYAGLKPQGFLQKPYTSKRLVDAVSNVLNRRET